MTPFVVGDASGEIVRWGETTDPSVHAAAGLLIEQAGDPATHYIANGVVVAYTSQQAANKAARPTYGVRWDNGSMTWSDRRSLDERRAALWDAVKLARDAAEFGGFAWDGAVFDSDTQAQSRIQGGAQLATLALLSAQPFLIDWTLADNAVRTLSGAEMIEVGRALGEHIVTVHALGRALRAEIEAATDVAQLDAIAWPA